MQCESDITFQRGQVQQSVIGTVCTSMQHQLTSYMAAAVGRGADQPRGVHPAAIDLTSTLVEVQADLLSLAPLPCLSQVPAALVASNAVLCLRLSIVLKCTSLFAFLRKYFVTCHLFQLALLVGNCP